MQDKTEILAENDEKTVILKQQIEEDYFAERIKSQYPDLVILEKLGRGAYGAVYRCIKTDTNTGFQTGLAIKVVEITASSAEAENIIKRDGISAMQYCEMKRDDAISEIKLLNDLKSPHIVHINDFDVVEIENDIGFTIFIKMDVLTPLTSLLKDCEHYSKKESEEMVRKLCTDMCDALKVCEAHKIIHRDIKPENIFYSKSESKIDFYLGDFGIARVLEDTESKMTAIGTVSYAAPEVFMLKNYDGRVDIYSLGIVLYQLANHGRLPYMPKYPGETSISDSTNAQSMRLNPKSKMDSPDNVSSKLSSVILRMCSFEPEDRYKNVESILGELNDGKTVVIVDSSELPLKENKFIKILSVIMLLFFSAYLGMQAVKSVIDLYRFL